MNRRGFLKTTAIVSAAALIPFKLLTELKEHPVPTQDCELHGTIYIDSSNGISVTSYPAGTKHHPVNNLKDALAIAKKYNITNFNII